MPRWTLYSLEGLLNDEDKQKIAEGATEIYKSLGLPPFLVNIFFNEYKPGQFYSGAKKHHDAVFFHMDHAAWSFPDEEYRLKFLASVDEVVSQVLQGKCSKWEYNCYEHPNENWRVNGMIPPVSKPEIWKQWMDNNGPVKY